MQPALLVIILNMLHFKYTCTMSSLNTHYFNGKTLAPTTWDPTKNITLTRPELLQLARLGPFFQAAFQEGDLHVIQKACIAQGDSNQSTPLYIISAHTSFHTIKPQSLTYVHTCTTTNQYTLATNLLAPMTQVSVV